MKQFWIEKLFVKNFWFTYKRNNLSLMKKIEFQKILKGGNFFKKRIALIDAKINMGQVIIKFKYFPAKM